MEGIIKFHGVVAGLNFLPDGEISVKLKYDVLVFNKDGEMEAQELREGKYIVLPYRGPQRFDSKTEAEFDFPDEIMHTEYGIGVPGSELFVGDEVSVFVRWRLAKNFSDMPDPPKHLIPDAVVISPLGERPENLAQFFDRVILPTL